MEGTIVHGIYKNIEKYLAGRHTVPGINRMFNQRDCRQ